MKTMNIKKLINSWATLTKEELNIYTISSPILVKDNKLYQEIISNEEWQPQGYIPTPKNKFEWFRHDIFHGIEMHYPIHKVFWFSVYRLIWN